MRLALSSCVLVGCLQSSSVQCPSGTLTCPQDTTCVVAADGEWCASVEQLGVCAGMATGAGCSFTGGAGTCFDGVCLPAACGNARIDFDEQCDDSNHAAGDGCSPDCLSTEICGNGLVDVITGELCDDGNRRAHDGCSNACSLETPAWQIIHGDPADRYGAAMTYDAARDRVLMFGGYTITPATSDLDDLWEWNGEQWHRIVTAIAPQPRTFTSMAYDAAHHETVLFGGVKLTTPTPEGFDPFPYDDTWIWNGATWRSIDAVGPSGRSQHTLAYDGVRKRVMLYGGKKRGTFSSTPLPFSDTWEWDGQAWTQVCATCAPGPRHSHATAYDPARGVMVMFGGESESVYLGDTWELAGGTWTKITPATTTPAARGGARLAFDPIARVLVLSGGLSDKGALTDTYVWNGQDWTASASLTATPEAVQSGVSTDPVRGEIIAMGGRSDTGIGSGATERWAASAWTLAQSVSPPAEKAAAAYDPARGRAAFVFAGDTTAWETDGHVWFDHGTIAGFAPRHGLSMAYDPLRREAVLFGGRSSSDMGDTWAWVDGAWALRSTGGPARSNHGMAFDGTNVMLFGGVVGSNQDLRDDTWLWNGTTWTQYPTTTRPPSRAEPSVAYDPLAGRALMFGGRGLGQAAKNDLWEWSGAGWTELVTTNRPQPRFGASLSWDPLRQRMVLFGGRTSSANDLDDTWELDGTTWTQLPLAIHPGAQHHHGMAFTPNGMTIAGDTLLTWRLQWDSVVPVEACGAEVDTDGDGAIGCTDEDCWATCSPECPPGASCDPTARRCGDTVCSPVEDCRSCAADCGPCNACGDFRCDGAETLASCPGDCTP